MKKITTQYLVSYLGILLLTGLDQITKYLAVKFLSPAENGQDVILWDGVFRLQYLENRGAAFGIMNGEKFFLIVSTLFIFLLLHFLVLHKIPFEKRFLPIRATFLCIMAGAMGNFIDRIRLGYVIDFLYFELIDFPIFNVADIYVTCAVAVCIVLFLFYYKEEELDCILSLKKKCGENL